MWTVTHCFDSSSLFFNIKTHSHNFFPGLATAQHPNVASLAAASAYYGSDQHSPIKYPENGHDTLSDFVTFVCQEAESTQGAQVSIYFF